MKTIASISLVAALAAMALATTGWRLGKLNPGEGDFGRLVGLSDSRLFTADVVPEVDDIGRGHLTEEPHGAAAVGCVFSATLRRVVRPRSAAWHSAE